ncbi:MAG: hypothetical protein K0B14_06940 [Anaerolineaceae bacterium]|jgi:adenylosuccinate lyase|nr:hypothetical protein [Anaerolineaceae bacterium]PKO06304.1 MAG: hypothetical protein CVU41_07680 [Chloroflexi bacterium HGW-Chloroflexi-3]PKO08681.1 MAG: hypothetical protein CVU40_14590 [Chloroflexi bacterium HGW-Chloroflexi-2]
MAQEVYMDVPAVQKIASNFGKFGQTLKRIAKGLETAIMVLKATAFVGMIGNLAVASYLERIKPRVEKLAEDMIELQHDVNAAVKHYQTGDLSGSARFRS